MADFYTQFSFVIKLTPEQKGIAQDRFNDLNSHPNADNWLDFDYKDEPEGWWIYSDEYGKVEKLADFLHDLIILCNLDPIGFEWANTCSKPRLESFGGGAVWITKDGFEWLSTNTWLYDKCSNASTPLEPENSASLLPPTEPEILTFIALAPPPADCSLTNIEELYNSIPIT